MKVSVGERQRKRDRERESERARESGSRRDFRGKARRTELGRL